MRIPVFLEVAADGRTMAHVLHLPGSSVVASTREAALAAVPAAIQGYRAWLAAHDEATDGEAGEIEVAEERRGFGPFDPGDSAALFGPDRKPLLQGELERLLKLMGYSRRDLLALIVDLPHQVLREEYTPG